MNRSKSVLVVAVAAAVLGMVAAAPAGAAAGAAAAATGPVSILWEMNEPPGASVMTDSGPLGINGHIGSEVQTGKVVSGATGYQFPRLKPNTPPTHPEHLVTIADQPELDPGTSPYTIEVRYRTTNGFGNLIQKGQSRTSGGQFKIQLPGGRVQCYFNGSAGKVGVGYKTPIDDGAWHVITCAKSDTDVRLFVDGVQVARHKGNPGNLDNAFPISIGGKTKCDQIKVTCDYFGGTIDYVRITKG